MSEEEQAVEQTATVDTPEQGTDTTQAQQDFEQRYKDAQAWGTQASQKAAELEAWRQSIETDPDAQREFLKGLGYDIEDPEPDVLPDDPTAAQLAAYEQRLAAIESKAQQDEMDRQLQAAEQHFDKAFTALGSERGSPLTEEEQNAVVGLALTMPAGPDGMPPVKDAFAQLEKLFESRQAAWAASKQTSHKFTSNGGPVSEDNRLDIDDPEERQRRMAQRLADLNNST